MNQEACPTQTNVTSLSFLVLQVNYFIQESLKQRYVAVVRKTSARILSLIPMSLVILKSNIYIYIFSYYAFLLPGYFQDKVSHHVGDRTHSVVTEQRNWDPAAEDAFPFLTTYA